MKQHKQLLLSFFLSTLIFCCNGGDSFTMLPSSCATLEDGLHFIQPMSQSSYKTLTNDNSISNGAPPIRVYCSNGYTIIDPSLDSNVESYFSTYHKYHTTFAGPDLDEGISWRVWWLPTRMDFNSKFMVSEDCETVDISNNNIQVYDDSTTYYMTGDSYGCNWPTKAMCDFNADTLECYTCNTNSDTQVQKFSNLAIDENGQEYYGKCGHMPFPSNSIGATQHSSCTEDTGSFLPSIGTTGRYCVAYKLSTSSNGRTSYLVGDSNLIDYGVPDMKTALSNEMYVDSQLTIYLDQDDFLSGTYRITQPGTYVITEDIEFDFNAGSLYDANAQDSWFPLSSQSDEYDGAGEWDGHYWLGFFAGITIETSNVILDLNGHSIGMSSSFYFQQRFFSCIELNNKIFLDGEGPTWTGTDITFSKNIEIKNGIVGLTSHIGIHGNKVYDLTISNIVIENFETHGLGINEFYNFNINNVEIGPSIDGQLGLNGNYNLARYTLPIFRDAAKQSGDDNFIKFNNRDDNSKTFNDIVQKLEKHMNIAWNYAYFGEKDSDNEEYDLAMKTFYNDWGISRAGTIYGAVIRSRGASVFNYGKDTGSGYSDSLTINGLYIHDIKLCMEEIIALGISQNSWMRDVFNAPLNIEAFTNDQFNSMQDVSGNINGNGQSSPGVSTTQYTGNAYLDAVFALKHFSTSWWYLGRLAIVEPFVTWTMDEEVDVLGDIDHTLYLHCNYDSLGHVPKGVVGLRMELSNNIEINDLRIENLYSFTPLGSDKCGAYKSGTDGGMPLQASTTNPGFGGTQARAFNIYGVSDMKVNNLVIKNIVSLNGPAYGIHGSPGKGISNNIEFSNVEFTGLYSGVDLTMNGLDYSVNHWPNVAASACAIEESEGFIFDKDTTHGSCIFGHVGCNSCKKDGLCSNIGQYNDECENTISLLAKDVKYTIESDGSATTEPYINTYKDVLTRIGDKAINTVSVKAKRKTAQETEAEEEEVVEVIETEEKEEETEVKGLKERTIVTRKKMTPISMAAHRNKDDSESSKNKNGNGSGSNNSDGEHLSDIGKFFLYGSVLFILLMLVIASKQLTPKYRVRKNHLETFETKLKYGKHCERLQFEEEMKSKGGGQSKKEEIVRLVNNTIGNCNDKEYDSI